MQRLALSLTATLITLGLFSLACSNNGNEKDGPQTPNRSQSEQPAAPPQAPLPTSPPAPPPTNPPPPTATKPADACPQGCTSTRPGCPIKGNVSQTTGEKIYHVPGGQFYDATVISPSQGERWFCTEQSAVRNGWRRSQR